MTKARDLADLIAAGSGLADGTVEVADITDLTASATELNYMDGVTSAVQTQLDAKGTVSSLADLSVTATATELNYMDGATSAVQTQLDAKMTPSYTGDVDITGELLVDSYNETYVALSGTTPSVDCEAGNVFSLATTGNTTFTFSNPPASGTAYGFTLKLTAGGTHTVTYPSSVDWADATAPDAPASGETDVLVFITHDGGSTWYGFQAGDALG